MNKKQNSTKQNDCYQNDESKEIEKMLNDARKECGLEDFLPPVEVWFTKKPTK